MCVQHGVGGLISLMAGILVCILTVLLGAMASFFGVSLFTDLPLWWLHLIVGVAGLLVVFRYTPSFKVSELPSYEVHALVHGGDAAHFLSTVVLDARNPKLLNLLNFHNAITATEMIGDVVRLGPRLCWFALSLWQQGWDARFWYRSPALLSLLGNLYAEDRKWTIEECLLESDPEKKRQLQAAIVRLSRLPGIITLHQEPVGIKMSGTLRTEIRNYLAR